MKLSTALVLIVGVLAACSSVAGIINVPSDQPTIQAGIDAALTGDTVLVADGHYYELLRIADKSICLASQMILDQDTAHITATIIDGDTSVVGVSDSNSVVLCKCEFNETFELVGLSIQRGIGTITEDLGRVGGGIWANEQMMISIRYCRITSNSSAASFLGGSGEFTHCRISENGYGVFGKRFAGIVFNSCEITDNLGHGVGVVEAALTFDHTRIERNAGYGAYINGGHLWHIWDCTISNNGGGLHWAGTQGGKIKWTRETAKDAGDVVYNTIISDNTGTGIYFGDVAGGKVRSCVISGNGDGGIVIHPDGYAFLDKCTLSQNGGSAIRLRYYGGYLEAADCLFEGNTASRGGAIAWSDGCIQIRNSTFVGNSADSGAVFSGIGSSDTRCSIQDFVNCVFANNVGGDPFFCSSGCELSVDLSCCNVFGNTGGDWVGWIADQYGASGNISADPQFCDTANGNYGIRSTSPCAPANNACGALIGAMPVACEPGVILAPIQYPTIQAAIDAAYDGDTVLIEDGVYYERISFKGKKITVASRYILDSDTDHIANTIIDGDTTVLGVSDTGSVVRCVMDEDTSSALVGLTIRNGSGGVIGGGVYCAKTLTIRRCVISANKGGGILAGGDYAAPLVIESCLVLSNLGVGIAASRASIRGSSILYNQGVGVNVGDLSIQGCWIAQNQSGGVYAGFAMVGRTSSISDNIGIGAYCSGSSGLHLTNCRIERNTSSGIVSEHASGGKIDSCVVSDNGEMGVDASWSFDVLNSSLIGNEGAGLTLEGDNFSVWNCRIENNGGGGIVTGGDGLEIYNSIIAGNTRTEGAGIYVDLMAHVTVSNTRFLSNSASLRGGAIHVYSGSQVGAASCLFLDNAAPIGSALSVINSSEFGPSSGIRCLIVDNFGSPPVYCEDAADSAIVFTCTDIFGNEGGDWVGCIADQASQNNNFSADPLFCDSGYATLGVHTLSPCLAANSPCGQTVGNVTLGACQGLQVTSVDVPPNMQHVIVSNPVIYWSYSDDMARPQTQFEIAVGSDTNWTYAECWNPAPVNSSDTFVTYGGSPLTDSTTYYFRLRLHNGAFWTNWYDGSFHTNGPPSAPFPAGPYWSTPTGPTPTLSVENSHDPENDPLTYQFAIYSDSMLTQLVVSDSNIPEGHDPDTTSWTVTPPLEENRWYYWHARAFDGYEYSEWSWTSHFIVNSANEPPSAPVLLSPPDSTGLPVFTRRPTLYWTISRDPDPMDWARYRVQVSLNESFTLAMQFDSLWTNSMIMPDSLPYGTHLWWRAWAVDRNGAETLCPEVKDFWIWVPGDIDHSHACDIGDLTALVDFLFFGAEITPRLVGDLNSSCSVDISDLSYLIDYLFFGGPVPREGC